MMAAAGAVLVTSAGTAHEFESDIQYHQLSFPAPSTQQISDRAKAGSVNAVVNAYKIWRAGQTLTVCFMGGDPTVRDFFVNTEREWEQFANIKWDFGAASYRSCDSTHRAHIRVAFAHTGHWSQVGTDSIIPQIVTEPSLNIDLQGFGAWDLADKALVKRTILHEVGHAIGLEHEHQSPNDPCIQDIKWPVVYADMAKPPNSWNPQKVDENIRPLVLTNRLRVTPYDPKSIMHYTFPASWFSDQACAVTQSLDLSPVDKQEVALAYPKDAGAQVDFINGVNKAASLAVDQLQLEPAQKAATRIAELREMGSREAGVVMHVATTESPRGTGGVGRPPLVSRVPGGGRPPIPRRRHDATAATVGPLPSVTRRMIVN